MLFDRMIRNSIKIYLGKFQEDYRKDVFRKNWGKFLNYFGESLKKQKKIGEKYFGNFKKTLEKLREYFGETLEQILDFRKTLRSVRENFEKKSRNFTEIPKKKFYRNSKELR